MKHLLITTIAAVVLVGCGNPEADRALLDAANDGNIKAVKQHLAAGADVNAKSKFGRTPLHHAAYFGHKEVAELLIAEGADVNAKDDDGATPLDLAARESPRNPLKSKPPKKKSQTSSANTAARPRRNRKPLANETPPTHNNRCRAVGDLQ